MTENEIRRRFPHCSRTFVKNNCDSRQIAELESAPGNDSLETTPAQKKDPERFLVRVTSYRKRLLDEDNLCEKYHVDCLRYAGIIPNDDPQTVTIQVCQKKSKDERVEIVIEK